ncbi:hypothetical protein niasHS_012414 [Heterodera schachtii]|uniref:Uncharacterized protein n=1 Tax=Heterodera schachtii TaxID=97005 RepID=A0ABD2IJJ6_HETSC
MEFPASTSVRRLFWTYRNIIAVALHLVRKASTNSGIPKFLEHPKTKEQQLPIEIDNFIDLRVRWAFDVFAAVSSQAASQQQSIHSSFIDPCAGQNPKLLANSASH